MRMHKQTILHVRARAHEHTSLEEVVRNIKCLKQFLEHSFSSLDPPGHTFGWAAAASAISALHSFLWTAFQSAVWHAFPQ